MRVACTAGAPCGSDQRPASTRGGAAALATWLGLLTVLFALLLPQPAGASGTLDGTPKPASGSSATAGLTDLHDDGACGEDEDPQELIDCGADLDAHFDEPLAITVLRETEVRTTRAQCDALLADIWSRQACAALSRDCGKLLPGAVPNPSPKLASSSMRGHAGLAGPLVDPASSRRLGRPDEPPMPRSRDRLPPVPPPKLVAG